MKKIVLSLAGVLAATAFAPEASALPAFARQTGMACTACHFQHFPVLNSFGRAFRQAGYTMVGAQSKVEGEHLSLAGDLNAGFLTKMRYQKTNGTDAAGTVSGTTTNSGQWQLPDELVLLFGGRVAENVGMLVEVGIAGSTSSATWGNATNGGILGGIKLPFIYDVGGAKVGVTPYITDGQGPFFGYDISSSGQVRASRWAEDRTATSAQNYVGAAVGGATGLAFSASNDMGFIAVSRFSPNHVANNGRGAVQLRSNLIRLGATPSVGGWEMLIGAGIISGNNYWVNIDPSAAAVTAANVVDTKGTTIDFQAQGQLGGKDTSFYVNYGKTDAGTAARPNIYNATVSTATGLATARLTDRKAWVVAGDYSVIPHVLSIAAAYRRGNTGATAANIAAGNTQDKDNAFTISAVYDLYQNVALHLSHSVMSGSAYGVGGTIGGATGVAANGKQNTLFMLEAAW